MGTAGRIVADTLTGAGFRVEGGNPVPVDVARHFYANVSWMLDSLQLEVPERTLSGSPYVTDGGRKFLLQVQRLLDGGCLV